MCSFGVIFSFDKKLYNGRSCNFEKFKMTGTKERIEYREKLCQNE